MTIGSKSNFLPWCGLIVTEKLSSSSRLSVKGLRANGESSEFSLALPKEHNFEEYNIESSCIQTGKFLIFICMQITSFDYILLMYCALLYENGVYVNIPYRFKVT